VLEGPYNQEPLAGAASEIGLISKKTAEVDSSRLRRLREIR